MKTVMDEARSSYSKGKVNARFDQWDKIFYDAVVANTILDRILHHSHVITITGDSYRLKDCVALTK